HAVVLILLRNVFLPMETSFSTKSSPIVRVTSRSPGNSENPSASPRGNNMSAVLLSLMSLKYGTQLLRTHKRKKISDTSKINAVSRADGGTPPPRCTESWYCFTSLMIGSCQVNLTPKHQLIHLA